MREEVFEKDTKEKNWEGMETDTLGTFKQKKIRL